ncbi:unnamed protein product [Cunninghamella blakesleeana]
MKIEISKLFYRWWKKIYTSPKYIHPRKPTFNSKLPVLARCLRFRNHHMASFIRRDTFTKAQKEYRLIFCIVNESTTSKVSVDSSTSA